MIEDGKLRVQYHGTVIIWQEYGIVVHKNVTFYRFSESNPYNSFSGLHFKNKHFFFLKYRNVNKI